MVGQEPEFAVTVHAAESAPTYLCPSRTGEPTDGDPTDS